MEQQISAGVFIWVLDNLCRKHRISFNLAFVIQQTPPVLQEGYGLVGLLP